MSLLRINDEAPDFTADTTHGPIQFHQWIGDNWAVFFSHPKDFTRDRRIAIHCAGGYRSSIAASILHHYRIKNLIEMTGGLAAWDAAHLPVVSEAEPRQR